jgi:c-di-GMP-binding flagellar brake protein YcgR
MKSIPISIGTEIFLRPLGKEKEISKASSRILGARPEDFLIIEEPIIRISERLTIPIKGEVLCWYFFDGDIYRFESRVMKSLGEGLALIEYPSQVQIQAVRKHQRIQVNIETMLSFEESRGNVKAVMEDISEGGGRLFIPSLVVLTNNAPCTVGFTMPDGQRINGAQSIIRSVKYLRIKKTTHIGIQFIGPPEELAKISSFCQFCMYFKV